jgi:hypothetical protein
VLPQVVAAPIAGVLLDWGQVIIFYTCSS